MRIITITIKRRNLSFSSKPRVNMASSLSDQPEQNWRVYHLAQRFSAESFSVCALCQKVYHVNWGVPFDFVFLPNKLDSLANKLLCRHCMLEAMTIIAELEGVEKELHKEDRKKREKQYEDSVVLP